MKEHPSMSVSALALLGGPAADSPPPAPYPAFRQQTSERVVAPANLPAPRDGERRPGR